MVDTVATFLKVAVAYVGPDNQVLRPMEVVPGTTVEGAIEGSGVFDQCPEIDLRCYKVGIFGKLVGLDTVLADGNRVEIYRPITADPETVERRDRD